MFGEIARLFVSVGANIDEFKKGMASVQRDMEKVGQNMTRIGKDLTRHVTLPLVGIGTAAFKLGKDFEKEMSKIVGLVGVASDQVDQWGRDILEMAPRLGKAPKELADALFFVTSAGLRGAEAMEVLEMSAKASAAGLGETKVIADLVTSAMNAYGAENLSAGQATDILVAAVREGKAEASELAASMGAVLPLASEMGITFDEVAAAQAAMTRTGTDAANASTQLKGIMSALISPSKGAEEAMGEMGMSSAELRKTIREDGLLAAMMELREKTNQYGEDAMAKVFPNIRALMGILDLMGNNMEENILTFDATANAVGSLENAFDSASQTAEHKWQAALSQMQVTSIALWQTLQHSIIPVMESVTEKIADLTKWFQELDDAQRENIIKWAMIAAAIGPVLILGGKLIGVIAGITKVVQGLTIAKVVLLGKIGLIIAAIAGLVTAGVYLYRNWDEIKTQLIAAWEMIRGAAVSVSIGVQRAWYGMQQYVWGVTRSILDAVAPLIDWLPDSVTRGFDRMRSQVGQKLGQLQGSLDDLSEQADANFARVRSAMTATTHTATETSNTYADQLDLMGRATESTASEVGFAVDDINAYLDELAGDVGTHTGSINDALGSTGGAAKQLAEEMGTAAEEISANYNQMTDEISITRQIMEAEYGLMAESMAGVMTESDKLLLELDRLSDELALQEKAVIAAKAAYEAMKKELDENAKETKELYLEYIKAEKEHARLTNAINTTREAERLLTYEINRQGGAMRDLQSEAQQMQRILTQEFRLIELQMRSTGDELDILREKNIMLGQQLAIQADLTTDLRSEYEALSATLGENAEETVKAYEAWLEAAIAQEQLKKSIEETTKAMSAQSTASTGGGGGGGRTGSTELVPGRLFVGPDVDPDTHDSLIQDHVDRTGATVFKRESVGTVTTVHDSRGTSYYDRDGKIETYDMGGIVPGPIGIPRLAMVHGGETILPTHKAGFGGTGGGVQTANITIELDGQTIGRAVGQPLVDEIIVRTGLRI